MIQNKAQSLKNQQSLLNMIQNPSTNHSPTKKTQSFIQSFFSRQILPNLNPFLNEHHHFITPKCCFFFPSGLGATLQGVTRSEVVQKAVEVPKRPSDRPGFWGDVFIGGGFFGARNDSPPNDPNKTPHESHKLLRSARSPDLPTGSVLVSIQLFEHLSHPGAIPVPWIQ